MTSQIHKKVRGKGLIPALVAKKDNMRAAASAGFTTATDLADYLARRNVPFRDAHEAVGRAVAYAIDEDKALDDLTLEELQRFHHDIDASVFDVLTLDGSVAARQHHGATAPAEVRKAVARARKKL